MTVVEFASWATGYYGPWPKGMQEDVREYLYEKDGRYLAMLKRVCLETVPTRIGQVNGYPPDIAKLIELSDEVGSRIDAEDRHQRELEYEKKLLPGPIMEVNTYSDLKDADWGAIFAARVRQLAEAKRFR